MPVVFLSCAALFIVELQIVADTGELCRRSVDGWSERVRECGPIDVVDCFERSLVSLRHCFASLSAEPLHARAPVNKDRLPLMRLP